MSLDFLLPVEDRAVAHTALISDLALGNHIKIHTRQNGIPDLKGVHLAIIGIQEGRNAVDNVGTGKDFDIIRKYLYQMYPGNWFSNIVDLGNLPAGKKAEDTYSALKEIVAILLDKKIIPIILGGSQDLTYACYRAYDNIKKGVSLVSVDCKFDLENPENRITSQNFLHKIIMEKPNNLLNYSNLGYQTFFNSQEEINLLDSLYFDAYRLGEVTADLSMAEPVLRDTDMVSIDMSAVRGGDAPANNNASPNGFYGDQICAIARYAGISLVNSLFGIYEYNAKYDKGEQTAHLIAQMIWYYIEGYNFRTEEDPYLLKEEFKKFMVLIEEDTIHFYKSNKSERWWMEIIYYHNKTRKSTLIPCTYQDYLTANNQIFPERWLKSFRKLN